MNRTWPVGLTLLMVMGCRTVIVPNPNFHDASAQGTFTASDLRRLSVGGSRPEVKFIITHFDDPARRQLILLDGHVYRMHDEWYWMRLLNGLAVPGSSERPVSGLDLRSVADAYAWAERRHLPLGLTWSEEGRLFSTSFYPRCQGERRRFGIGSLLWVKSRQGGGAEAWAFQLEYVDKPSREVLHVFAEVLGRALPREVTSELRWLTRSAEQESVARKLQAAGDPIGLHALNLRDVVGVAQIEVYSEGITAGQVRMFKSAPPAPGSTSSDDIVVLEAAPDELPAAAGLITATPQTPLAHVVLLARNRGIPNAYMDHAFSEPAMAAVMTDGTKAILRAEAPDRLALVPITEEQFATYAQLRRRAPLSGTHPDASNAALSFDLSKLDYDDAPRLRSLIGGKAAGYLLLATQRHVPIVGPARVITTRAFDEHLAGLQSTIDRVLREPEFATNGKIRYLLLEGVARFEKTQPGDKETVPRFLAGQGEASPLVSLVRSGGVTGAIRRTPVAPRTMQRLRAELLDQFGAAAVALRFRSSSTLEDIEGFNAAGLYESATGYVDPATAEEPKDREHGFEYAIKKVWASYWGFVAVEERQREGIYHRSGAMAILVHPRFDDEAELANGVLTLTRLPNGSARMRVAAQVGATSVTNPIGGSQPEVASVECDAPASGANAITRVQASSMTKGVVLKDAELDELCAAGEALTATALEQVNRGLDSEQRRRTYTLDVELKVMAPNWRGFSAPVDSRTLVLKQARSLEPEPRGMDPSLLDEPIGRDLLVRARRIDLWRCRGQTMAIDVLSLLTDVKSVPDMGYRERPYIAWVKWETSGQGAVRWLARDCARLEQAGRPGADSYALEVELGPEAVAQAHIKGLRLESTRATVEGDDGRVLAEPVECSRRVLFNTADAYLLDLVAEKTAESQPAGSSEGLSHGESSR